MLIPGTSLWQRADHYLQDEEVHGDSPESDSVLVSLTGFMSLSRSEPLSAESPSLLTTVTGLYCTLTVQYSVHTLYCTTTDGYIYAVELLTASLWLVTGSQSDLQTTELQHIPLSELDLLFPTLIRQEIDMDFSQIRL